MVLLFDVLHECNPQRFDALPTGPRRPVARSSFFALLSQ